MKSWWKWQRHWILSKEFMTAHMDFSFSPPHSKEKYKLEQFYGIRMVGPLFFFLAILSLAAPWFVHSRYVLCKPCGAKERERGVQRWSSVYCIGYRRREPADACALDGCLQFDAVTAFTRLTRPADAKRFTIEAPNLSSSPSQTIRMKMQWIPTQLSFCWFSYV